MGKTRSNRKNGEKMEKVAFGNIYELKSSRRDKCERHVGRDMRMRPEKNGKLVFVGRLREFEGT